MTEIVVADIGGTHARFAIADISDAKNITLKHLVTLQSDSFASLPFAWQAYGSQIGQTLPNKGAIAVAAPITGENIRLTNSTWTFAPNLIGKALQLERHVLINDFGAVCHSVAAVGQDKFSHICGPDTHLPDYGLISVIGPGTGLGVAHILRAENTYTVTETEGGHIGFAPQDELEERLLIRLKKSYDRVSVERVAAGPGLQEIYLLMAERAEKRPEQLDSKALWKLALSGEDALATAALNRFCRCLGNIVGDLALAQGAQMVVLAGGLGERIAEYLPSSEFEQGFFAKGRFQSIMEQIPVKQLRHAEPGLHGAAIAFIRQHCTSN